MPELPEVEVTRQGLRPHLLGQRLTGAVLREPRLRWPVPADLAEHVSNRRIAAVRRRAKYLLLELEASSQRVGTLLIHLGMSGSLRVAPGSTPPAAHDHLDLALADGRVLRLRDPRRFGAVLWTSEAPEDHPRLRGLGIEPLGTGFTGRYLYARSRGRKAPIKAFLMDSSVVAGIGNIYAGEALFRAGIHPARAAGRVGRDRYRHLTRAVRGVLEEAIAAGGTTLRDFTSSEGAPGYFRQALAVYGRSGKPCLACGRPLCQATVAQRTSVYCPRCQR